MRQKQMCEVKLPQIPHSSQIPDICSDKRTRHQVARFGFEALSQAQSAAAAPPSAGKQSASKAKKQDKKRSCSDQNELDGDNSHPPKQENTEQQKAPTSRMQVSNAEWFLMYTMNSK